MNKSIGFFIALLGLLFVSCSIQSPFRQSGMPSTTPLHSPTSSVAPVSTPVVIPKSNIPQQFSPSTINSVAPDDILKEVFAFLGAGGPGARQICDPVDSLEPRIDDVNTTKEIEWLSRIEIPTCGWQPNEVVRVTVQIPDGRNVTQIYQAIDGFSWTRKGEITFGIVVYYSIQSGDPIGLYHFMVEGVKNKLSFSVNVIKPKPHFVSMPTGTTRYSQISTNKFFLYGFYPNERIRLFVYQSDDSRTSCCNATLIGYQSFTTDSNGQLLVDTNLISRSGLWYVVVGDLSGEIRGVGMSSIMARPDRTSTSSIPLPTKTPGWLEKTLTQLRTRCDTTWFFTPPSEQCKLYTRSISATMQVFKKGRAIAIQETQQIFIFWDPPLGINDDTRSHSWDAFPGDFTSVFLANPSLKFDLGEPTSPRRSYQSCIGIGMDKDNGGIYQSGYMIDADNRLLKFVLEGASLDFTSWMYLNNRISGCSDRSQTLNSGTPSIIPNGPGSSRTQTIPPTTKPGVYIREIKTDPPAPKQRQDITFNVTFLNTTGTTQRYRWYVQIYDQGKPIGQTSSDKTYDIPIGVIQLPSYNAWKIGQGQPCKTYEAKVVWLGSAGTKPVLTGIDGREFSYPFTVCP